MITLDAKSEVRVAVISALIGLGTCRQVSVTMVAPASVAQTTAGQVRGKPDLETIAFLGVPYGADTGGANRFLAPQKVVPWKGVRDALEYGPRCPQQPALSKAK